MSVWCVWRVRERRASTLRASKLALVTDAAAALGSRGARELTPTLPSSPPRSNALADSARAMLTTMAEPRAHPTPHDDDDDDDEAATPTPEAQPVAKEELPFGCGEP